MEILRAGDASVTIDHAHGARLASLQIGPHELLRSESEGTGSVHGWGAFVMAPFAGRIRHGQFAFDGQRVSMPINHDPHAIHGTVVGQAWSHDGPGVASTTFGPTWPWSGQITQTVELEPHRLSLTLTVASEVAMPVTAGWHPWFHRRLGAATIELTLPAERMWARRPDGIPDGSLVDVPAGPWDDCFTALIGPVQLRWPDTLTLWVESDCEHVVVYDEQADYVCVEPQSAPPDAHNSHEDLVVVEPDNPWSITTTWTWSTD